MINFIKNISDLQYQPCHWVLCIPREYPLSRQQLSCLNEDELIRCQRFRQLEDQQRFKVAHVFKRELIAQQLNESAITLQFSVGEKGKPFCTHPQAPFFNLSHSSNWILIGLSKAAEMGVDVEYIHRQVDPSIYPSVLSKDELVHVQQDAHPSQRFIHYWTQKEAACKALGLGISHGLSKIQCSGQFGVSNAIVDKAVLQNQTVEMAEHLVSVSSPNQKSVQFYKLEQ